MVTVMTDQEQLDCIEGLETKTSDLSLLRTELRRALMDVAEALSGIGEALAAAES